MRSPGDKLAYTVEEAAELLSLSRAHLYRLIDVGELGSVTIGRSRRITHAQLEEFIGKLEARAIPLHGRFEDCGAAKRPGLSTHGQ